MEKLLEAQKESRRLKAELEKGGSEPVTVEGRVRKAAEKQYVDGEDIFAVQYTSVHKCADSDNVAGLKHFVLDKACDPSTQDRWGNTPLHLAATRGHTNSLSLLLELESDPNAKNNKGWTPAHEAAVGGHCDILEILFERGADMTLRDVTGGTAAHLAAQSDNAEVLETLHKFQEFPLGPEVLEVKMNNGMTPAHQAALYNSPNALRFLASTGANLDARDMMNETPAHKAARSQKQEALAVLREVGCDPSRRNDEDDDVEDLLVDEARCWHTDL
jgi:ankyrin repeat protein